MRTTVALSLLALAVGVAIGFGTGTDQKARRARPEAQATQPEARDTGTITGRITTADGEPVPGVVVSALPVTPPHLGDGQAAGDGPADLAAFKRWQEAARRQAVSSADGSYAVTGIHDEPYAVRAQHPSYRLATAGAGSAQVSGQGGQVDFVATPIHHAILDVRLPDGSQPARAKLHWKPSPRRAMRAWTPELMQFELEPGEFEVHATAGAHDEFRSGSARITTTVSSEPIVLQLQGRAGIRGRIVLPQGWSPPNMIVRAGPAAAYRPDKFRSFGKRRGLRGNEREFVFLDLEPGRYVVAISLDGSGPATQTEVVVAQGLASCELKIANIADARSRVVRVLGPDGKPLANAHFSIRYRCERGGAVGLCAVIDRGDGSYLVRPMDTGLPEGGTYTLTTGSKKLGWVRRAMPVGDPSEFVVKLSKPATVQVTVEGYESSGLAGNPFVHVQLAGEEDQQRFVSRSRIDKKGVYKVGPVQSGEVELLLGVKRGPLEPTTHSSAMFWVVARERITIKPGLNHAWIAVPALHDLWVINDAPTRDDGPTFDRILIHPTGPSGKIYLWYAKIKRGQRSVLERLAAGTYVLSGHDREQNRHWKRTITVPGDSTIRIPQ